MKTAMKTAKVALIIAFTSVMPTAAASVQGHPGTDQQEDTTLPRPIIAKMLPPEQQSKVPRSIATSTPVNKTTDGRHPDFEGCRIEPIVSSILKTAVSV